MPYGYASAKKAKGILPLYPTHSSSAGNNMPVVGAKSLAVLMPHLAKLQPDDVANFIGGMLIPGTANAWSEAVKCESAFTPIFAISFSVTMSQRMQFVRE
jgi:hypothetical protein